MARVRKRGFTFVEIVVCAVVIAVVFAVAGRGVWRGARTGTYHDQVGATRTARRILDRVEEDLFGVSIVCAPAFHKSSTHLILYDDEHRRVEYSVVDPAGTAVDTLPTAGGPERKLRLVRRIFPKDASSAASEEWVGKPSTIEGVEFFRMGRTLLSIRVWAERPRALPDGAPWVPYETSVMLRGHLY